MKWALTLVFCAMVVTGALADNALTNPGFESGALAPWFNSTDFCGGCTWSVTSSDAHSGTFSAFVSGNRLLEQDFAPIAVSDISEVSLWLRMPETGIAAVFFLYSDLTTDENTRSLSDGNWTYFNMTSYLAAASRWPASASTAARVALGIASLWPTISWGKPTRSPSLVRSCCSAAD